MARERFVGAVPRDRLYDSEHHMWVKRDGELYVVGATSFGLYLAGEVIAFMPKPVGAQVDRGRGLGIVETGKTVLSVRSPLSMVLAATNDVAMERPELLMRDPYGSGWMARGSARGGEDNLRRLVDAQAYREQCIALEPDAQMELVP